MEKQVGICIAQMQDDTRQMQVRAICENARKKQYRVLIFNSFEQLLNKNSFIRGELQIFERIPMEKLSALVIFAESFLDTAFVNALIGRARQYKLPVICVDKWIEGCYNVLFAYEEAFETLVRHIVEHHGCRRINFMAGFEENEFSDARVKIFQRVLVENGIAFEADRMAYGQFWEMPAKEAARQWVSMWQNGTQEVPEAVICANDIMALTVCNVLTDAGYHVPEDILLTGFDGVPLERYCQPRLTTACDNVELLGERVVAILDDCLANRGQKPYDIWIPFQTRFSQSCGCAAETEEFEYNPNEQIMRLYGHSARMRVQSTDVFLMMNALTDGYSALELTKQMERYINLLSVQDLFLVINRRLYHDTDLPYQDFKEKSMMLLVQVKDGVYTTLFREILPRSEYALLDELLQRRQAVLFVPIHWQEEFYGFLAVAYQDIEDLGGFYNAVLGFEQAFGTLRKQSQLHQMYVTDVLTGLYNRQGLYIHIEKRLQALAGRKLLAFIVSVDMDGLKYINDTYGHAEGDFAIRAVAEILRDSLGERRGICARFGGDEYAVAMITQEEKADIAFYEGYEELLQELSCQFNETHDKPYSIGMSVGTSLGHLEGMEDVNRMMKEADQKMYRRKEEHHRKM